jgi:hypothetical protein
MLLRWPPLIEIAHTLVSAPLTIGANQARVQRQGN